MISLARCAIGRYSTFDPARRLKLMIRRDGAEWRTVI